ncbi:MAG: hypothetical protein J5779_03060 [Clostridia bacterium]|nr:hypothetical protein [Clostridia bacterium]
MWQEILNIVISNGIFATLFVLLLGYLLKDSSKREQKYSDAIESLADKLNKAMDIKTMFKDQKDGIEKNTHIIKKVRSDVKSVKKDVKEIKQILSPKEKNEEI